MNHCKNQLKTPDFFDIDFDLVKETQQLYKKPNVDPLYINKKTIIDHKYHNNF